MTSDTHDNADDEGVELLQRARLLVQAASNLPDFSTLFSKRNPPEEDNGEASSGLPVDSSYPHHESGAKPPVVVAAPKKSKKKKPPVTDSNNDQHHHTFTSNADEATAKTAQHKQASSSSSQPEHPQHSAFTSKPDGGDDAATTLGKQQRKAKKKAPTKPCPEVVAEVDSSEKLAAQALARKYAQERAAARVASKLREKLAEKDREEQSHVACVHEFYETLDDKEQRLKGDRIRAKERLVKAKHAKELEKQMATNLPGGNNTPHAAPLSADQLEKFQRQTKERLVKAKEAKRQAELLQLAKLKQEEEDKARHLADEAAAADDTKRRADQVRRETKRRLKAMQAHKEDIERKELELRQQGLDKYKHHKDEMERVAKGGGGGGLSSVSKPGKSKQPLDDDRKVLSIDKDEVEATVPLHDEGGRVPHHSSRTSDNNDTIADSNEPDRLEGHENSVDVSEQSQELPPLVAPSAETATAAPLKKIGGPKKALWKRRPPVPIPTADEIVHRSKQANMPPVTHNPGGAPPHPRHDSYADRMKSRSAPSSLSSQAERLASATRERAKQMDNAAK
ncbi:hypothetical protein, variant 1 [Aphanomyces astaci]|uniref:Uncharacterized protein n=1 Tax=Aphanomyces astaci TaxID=112090 RepID=W4G095_APHAT|nr:hypothetical protein, variant 1 [Aphanomyces astaci]ETV72706.1 hypothetical protein, variant 1 [Aphanomyces astaci]|eukprot:XP_009837934.1 hypothetical protein, variant 1 [Aphanomyces astaci]